MIDSIDIYGNVGGILELQCVYKLLEVKEVIYPTHLFQHLPQVILW